MGQLSCCGSKTPSFNNQAKTPCGDFPLTEVEQCHPTYLFSKSEEQLLNEEFICSICLNVVKNAVKDPCGHIFGETCIKSWIKRNPKCPYSQQSLSCSQLTADKHMRSLVIKEMETTRENTQKQNNYLNQIIVEIKP